MGDIVLPQPLRAWNANGLSSAGARATFYLSGTTTPATVYADAAETVPHPSPLIADSGGNFPAIFRSGVALKCVLTDANGAALPGSPIDPCPIVREGGGTASEITFIASDNLPYDNVQAAIEGGFESIRGQTKPFTAPVLAPNGTASLPAFSFESDPDTGAYRPGANRFAVAVGGAKVVECYPGLVDMSVPLMGAARQTLLSFGTSVAGTANAITVDMPVGEALIAGLTFWFRPGSANTGATTLNLSGTGAKHCVTVTGVGLPSGYLRAGRPTVVFYDGASWVVRRDPEYGANANGAYWRYEDGRQECTKAPHTLKPAGANGTGRMASAWDFPAIFYTTENLALTGSITTPEPEHRAAVTFGPAAAINTTNVYYQETAGTSAEIVGTLSASGRWY